MKGKLRGESQRKGRKKRRRKGRTSRNLDKGGRSKERRPLEDVQI